MPASWTVMVYMAGDNDLSDKGKLEGDLKDIRRSTSSAGVRVLVFVKDRTDGYRYLEHCGGEYKEKRHTEDADAGTVGTVVKFVQWAVDTAPAERYALVIWGHGSGWRPDKVSHDSPGILARLYSEDSVGGGTRTGNSLDTTELATILRSVNGILAEAHDDRDRTLDLLGMDACLMCSVEVVCQLRDGTTTLVASEHLFTDYGWPYEEVLTALSQNSQWSATDLASEVVTACRDYYGKRLGIMPVTKCALNFAKWDSFASSFDRLCRLLHESVARHRDHIRAAQQAAVHLRVKKLPDLHLIDLASFCRHLEGQAFDADLSAAAAAVLSSLEPSSGGFVLAEVHYLVYDQDVGGISVYMPPPGSGLGDPKGYDKLTFAAEFDWRDFLLAYAGTSDAADASGA